MGYCKTPGCTLRNCDPSTPDGANYDPKINGAFYKKLLELKRNTYELTLDGKFIEVIPHFAPQIIVTKHQYNEDYESRRKEEIIKRGLELSAEAFEVGASCSSGKQDLLHPWDAWERAGAPRYEYLAVQYYLLGRNILEEITEKQLQWEKSLKWMEEEAKK